MQFNEKFGSNEKNARTRIFYKNLFFCDEFGNLTYTLKGVKEKKQYTHNISICSTEISYIYFSDLRKTHKANFDTIYFPFLLEGTFFLNAQFSSSMYLYLQTFYFLVMDSLLLSIQFAIIISIILYRGCGKKTLPKG